MKLISSLYNNENNITQINNEEDYENEMNNVTMKIMITETMRIIITLTVIIALMITPLAIVTSR